LALIASFPANIPIVLTGSEAITAIIALLVIGPLGGLVSVLALVRVEPLRALGLAQ
jgi:putative ABC transport system permease protein